MNHRQTEVQGSRFIDPSGCDFPGETPDVWEARLERQEREWDLFLASGSHPGGDAITRVSDVLPKLITKTANLFDGSDSDRTRCMQWAQNQLRLVRQQDPGMVQFYSESFADVHATWKQLNDRIYALLQSMIDYREKAVAIIARLQREG